MTGLTGRRSPNELVVLQWMGISTDEVHRARLSGERWMQFWYPLLSKRMSRGHCIDWLTSHGFAVPPKSACTFCPYHDDAQWIEIKRDPAAWNEAVEIDRRIRTLWKGKKKSEMFLHRSMKPLDEVELDENDQMDLFACTGGVCGV